MRRTRPPYPPEFRRQVVELVLADRTPEELGREFEPTATTIGKWLKQAAVDEGPEAGETREEKQEIRRLRREVHQLKMERRRLVRSGVGLRPIEAFEFTRAGSPRTAWVGQSIDRHDGSSARGLH